MDVKTVDLADASLAIPSPPACWHRSVWGEASESPASSRPSTTSPSARLQPDRLQIVTFSRRCRRIDHAHERDHRPPSSSSVDATSTTRATPSNTSRRLSTRALVQLGTTKSAHAWRERSVDASHAIGFGLPTAVTSRANHPACCEYRELDASTRCVAIGQVDAVPRFRSSTPITPSRTVASSSNRTGTCYCSRTRRQGHCASAKRERSVRACRHDGEDARAGRALRTAPTPSSPATAWPEKRARHDAVSRQGQTPVGITTPVSDSPRE